MSLIGACVCDVCEDPRLEPVQCICNPHIGKLNSVAITACGVSFNNCLTDSNAMWDRCSTDANYPNTYPDGTPHPLAGQPNPNRATLNVFQQVTGDIYTEPDTEETDLSAYSCISPVAYGDSTFTITVTRLYDYLDEPFYKQLDRNQFGEIAAIDDEAIGHILRDASLRVYKSLDGEVKTVNIDITFKQDGSFLCGLPVAAPLFSDCD